MLSGKTNQSRPRQFLVDIIKGNFLSFSNSNFVVTQFLLERQKEVVLQKHPVIKKKLTILSGSLAGLKFPREFIVIWKKEIYLNKEKFLSKEIQTSRTRQICIFANCTAEEVEAMHQSIRFRIVNLVSRLKSNLQRRVFVQS